MLMPVTLMTMLILLTDVIVMMVTMVYKTILGRIIIIIIIIIITAAVLTPRLDSPEELDKGIGQESGTGDDAVGDDEASSLVHHLQAEPAVNDAEDHQTATPPNMEVADRATGAVLEVVQMVKVAEHRLDTEQADDDSAEDAVLVAEELGVLGLER